MPFLLMYERGAADAHGCGRGHAVGGNRGGKSATTVRGVVAAAAWWSPLPDRAASATGAERVPDDHRIVESALLPLPITHAFILNHLIQGICGIY